MLRVYIIDSDEEATALLHEQVLSLLSIHHWESSAIPDLTCEPMPFSGITGSNAPALCIIGPKLIEQSSSCINVIAQRFPNALLAAKLSPRMECLKTIRCLAEHGVHDVIPAYPTARDIIERLILLQRRLPYPADIRGICH